MNDTVDNVFLMKRIELEYFAFLHVEVQFANVQNCIVGKCLGLRVLIKQQVWQLRRR